MSTSTQVLTAQGNVQPKSSDISNGKRTSTQANITVEEPDNVSGIKQIEIQNDKAGHVEESSEHVVKKRKIENKSVIIHAEDFDLNKHVYFPEIQTGKFRTVKLQVSSTNKAKVRIQFSRGPGYIPNKFGVDTNQYGKTFLTFGVPNENEFNSMNNIKNAACEIAKSNKDTWWSKGITDDQIVDNFNTFIGEKNPKKDGNGFWPAQMKVVIPIDNETGDVQNCKILDDDGSSISIHDLPGRKWDKVVIELSGIYFQGKYTWGFGPKKLVNVLLAEDEYGGNTKEDIGFLESKPQQKE